MENTDESMEVVNHDLPLDEQLDAHRKGWKAQQWGLGFLYAVVVMAAVGMFGDGLASKAKDSTGDIHIESERFYRHEARMELKVTITNATTDILAITFPNSYLQHFRVESIQPEPAENNLTDGHVSYRFQGKGSARITFHLIPQKVGTIEGTIEVNEKHFSLKHFIYP